MDKKYHFIGLGGIGMSGLAKLVLEQGGEVSGSDQRSSLLLDLLRAKGANVFIGHSADQVPLNSSVIYSTDIALDNPEYEQAKELGIPLLHRSMLLQQLMQGKKPLLVVGTHGKTTTTSLLTHLLLENSYDPSYSIGGILHSTKTNAALGKGSYFVAEADESDGSFLNYEPFGAIFTNIDTDHLNFWKNMHHLIEGFKNFYDKVQFSEFLFWCGDDLSLKSFMTRGTSYGISPEVDLQAVDIQCFSHYTRFRLIWKKQEEIEFEIPLLGTHNVLNSVAVIGLCRSLGIAFSEIQNSLTSFQGSYRRSEKKGESRGITVYDDYGHHPTEIKATLKAFRDAFPQKRLVVVFQPHRFSRTRDCLDEFPAALEIADLILITDLYGAGESPIEGISGKSLSMRIINKECHFVPFDQLISALKKQTANEDLVITMGAGSITTIGPLFLQEIDS